MSWEVGRELVFDSFSVCTVAHSHWQVPLSLGEEHTASILERNCCACAWMFLKSIVCLSEAWLEIYPQWNHSSRPERHKEDSSVVRASYPKPQTQSPIGQWWRGQFAIFSHFWNLRGGNRVDLGEISVVEVLHVHFMF